MNIRLSLDYMDIPKRLKFCLLIWYRIVANNLQTLDPTRKGYRSVGGALIEGTVETILPVVETNRDQVSKIIILYNKYHI